MTKRKWMNSCATGALQRFNCDFISQKIHYSMNDLMSEGILYIMYIMCV